MTCSVTNREDVATCGQRSAEGKVLRRRTTYDICSAGLIAPDLDHHGRGFRPPALRTSSAYSSSLKETATRGFCVTFLLSDEDIYILHLQLAEGSNYNAVTKRKRHDGGKCVAHTPILQNA